MVRGVREGDRRQVARQHPRDAQPHRRRQGDRDDLRRRREGDRHRHEDRRRERVAKSSRASTPGFSIGGSYEKKWKDSADATKTRYTAAPAEISLVDNPCVPTATFSMVKADGSSEAKPFQRYGALKAVIADASMTNGDLFKLATAYLPDEQLEEMAKAETTMGDVRAALKKLADEDARAGRRAAGARADAGTRAEDREGPQGARARACGRCPISPAVCARSRTSRPTRSTKPSTRRTTRDSRRSSAPGSPPASRSSRRCRSKKPTSCSRRSRRPRRSRPRTSRRSTSSPRSRAARQERGRRRSRAARKFIAVDALEKVATLEKLNGRLTLQLLTAARRDRAGCTPRCSRSAKGSLRVVDKIRRPGRSHKTDDPNARRPTRSPK
jgi:hypothetical protein